MDDAAQARAATREAVADITPVRLQKGIDERLATTSVIPGVLTLVSARVCDGTAASEDVRRRAAGVQLIYEGLRLTRSLVADPPWTPNAPPNIPADVDVLAADVLVSQGFRLLAQTEAADRAVETVRAFGREETDRQAGRATTAGRLEADVFELAVVAGATAGGNGVPLALRQYVVGLARARTSDLEGEPLPAAADGLPETIEEVMERVSTRAPAEEPAVAPEGAVNRND